MCGERGRDLVAVNVPMRWPITRLAGVLCLQLRPRRRGQHVLVHGPLPGDRRLQRWRAPAWAPSGIAVAFLLLGALGAVTWLALLAPVKPRLGQLAFLSVLAFLLTTKVWSPQYSIWLVPLLALARPRWRLNLFWQFSEVGVWIATLFWLLGFKPRPRHRLRLADAGPADPRRPADRDRGPGHSRDLVPRTRHGPHRPARGSRRRPVRRRAPITRSCCASTDSIRRWSAIASPLVGTVRAQTRTLAGRLARRARRADR